MTRIRDREPPAWCGSLQRRRVRFCTREFVRLGIETAVTLKMINTVKLRERLAYARR